MKFESRSQAGQDTFVFKTLVEGLGIAKGTFLDIGANHPIDWSNSYALEQLGWTGFLFENEPNACNMLRAGRTSPVVQGDATKIDWRNFAKTNSKHFNYLSLDIDYCSHGVVLETLCAGLSFDVATIEHNEYAYPGGDSPAWSSRALMQAKGYELVARNVRNNNAPFEDWYARRNISDFSPFIKFASAEMDGLELAAR